MRNNEVDERLTLHPALVQTPGMNHAPGRKIGMRCVTRTVTQAVVVLFAVGQAPPVQATSTPSSNGAVAGSALVLETKLPAGLFAGPCHIALE